MRDKTVYLSLGSNLGNRQENLSKAIAALERDGIRVTARSSIYESEPQDVREQPWFLNQVIACETRCFPLQLLTIAQRVERELGRVRAGVMRRGPRTMDIDILLFEQVKMQTARLTIPHPRMLERRFALEPLLEIAPELREPGSREPLRSYLARLKAQAVKRMTAV